MENAFNGYTPLEDATPPENQDPLFSMEDLGNVFPLLPEEFGTYQDKPMAKRPDCFKDQPVEQQQQPSSNDLPMDDYLGSCFPAPALPIYEVKKLENMLKPTHPLAPSSSLALLNNYGSGFKKLNANHFDGFGNGNSSEAKRTLSTEDIIRVAGARYIQFSDQRYDDLSMLMHPFGHALSGLSDEETTDVELAQILLAAAEKVGYQQYDRANRLLSRCDWISSERSNPLQRVVYYFAEALRERIDKATGRFTSKEPAEETVRWDTMHGLGLNLAHITLHQKVPFGQVMQLTAIQAIIENIGNAKKVHLIDLAIRTGVQWTSLMQALAVRQRRLEHLKITALDFLGRDKIEETGKRLESFAKSLNLPFTFKAVHVKCMLEIKEELFETQADECVVVVSSMLLRAMLSRPEVLENLMRVIKNLKPSIMLVAEVEANHNSPAFVNRFIEALFFYCAYFDCLETCIDDNIEHRTMLEAEFRNGIQNIVAKEGTDRIARSVKLDVWRAFFARFRMVEIGFSDSSLYQASLVPKQFPSGSLCSLESDGKGLILGWKGTPLHSLTTWKFCRKRYGR